MKGYHLFFIGAVILVVQTFFIAWDDSAQKGGIPEPRPAASRLTNIPFTPTTGQRELIELINGTQIRPGKYQFVSPASPEETSQICSEMQFSLPVFVECEGRIVIFDVADSVRGTVVMHSWIRRLESGELEHQEFLEMGLLLTAECGQDLCVPLNRNVKFTPPVEGEDHRTGVAQ